MPIDELAMVELYVQLFPEKQTGNTPTETEESFFQAPGDELVADVTRFDALFSAQGDIFTRVSNTFQDRDKADLSSVANKLSEFLGEAHEEITSSIDPDFRVLEYVYPIV